MFFLLVSWFYFDPPVAARGGQFVWVPRTASRHNSRSSRLSGPHSIQSATGYIAPRFALKSPQMGTLLLALPQMGQMKIALGILFVCIPVTVKKGSKG